MKVCDLLKEESISLLSKPDSKRDAIKSLVKLMNKNKNLKKVGEFQKVVFETEEEFKIKTVDDVAILYGKTKEVSKMGLSVMVVKEGIDFDGDTKLLFLFGVPESSTTYSDTIDELNNLLKNKAFKNKLINCKSKNEFIKLFEEVKKEKVVEKSEVKIFDDINTHLKKGTNFMLPFMIIGGIFIALSFLFDNYSLDPNNFGLNTAVAAFFNIIGSYALEIMLCVFSGFIAYSIADKEGLAVGFIGGILTNRGISIASLYIGGRVVGSGFFGALIVGLVSGYLILLLKKLKLPFYLSNYKNKILNCFIGIILISLLVMLIINPIALFINESVLNYLTSIQTANKILLGLVLGGMTVIDLGGPISKAAYTFGISTLASGHYDIMAAIIAAGMVPPLVIAVLATCFPKKLEKNDRGVAYANYILGFANITEGAMYFAGKDLIKTIPAFIVGSSCAAVCSIVFDCGIKTFVGGIFALSAIVHPILFLVSILFGAVVGALILNVLLDDIK